MNMNRILAFLVFVILAIAVPPLHAETDTDEGGLNLRGLVDKLFAAEPEELAPEEGGGPVLDALESLRLYGRIQLHWNMKDETDVTSGVGKFYEKEGFRVRRLRLGFAGEAFNKFQFDIQIGESETEGLNQVEFLDANVSYHACSHGSASVGMDKVPFSRQALASSRNIQFIERALVVSELSPGRDIGIQMEGKLLEGKFLFAGGVFNGNEATFAGDDNSRFLWAARVVAFPLGSYPSIESDFERKLACSIGGSFYRNHKLESISNVYGLEADLRLRGFSVSGEYIYAESRPEFSGEGVPALFDEEIIQSGYYVQGGVFVFVVRV